MDTDHTLGYPIRREHVVLRGRSLEILMPADQDELLDDPGVQTRFEEDEYLPYWGQLWPASTMLAESILADEPGRGRRALEVGCGLGLAALAARMAGWDVLATDYDEDALRFAAENARINELGPLKVRRLDWRRPTVLERYERIFAADVLYERRHHQPIAGLVQALLARGGVAVICDPNRETARDFDDALRHAGLAWEISASQTHRPCGRYVEGTRYRIWHASARWAGG